MWSTISSRQNEAAKLDKDLQIQTPQNPPGLHGGFFIQLSSGSRRRRFLTVIFYSVHPLRRRGKIDLQHLSTEAVPRPIPVFSFYLYILPHFADFPRLPSISDALFPCFFRFALTERIKYDKILYIIFIIIAVRGLQVADAPAARYTAELRLQYLTSNQRGTPPIRQWRIAPVSR